MKFSVVLFVSAAFSIHFVKVESYQHHTYSYCPLIAGQKSECRPIHDCAVWYDAVQPTPGTACKLSGGIPGACCPSLPKNSKYVTGFAQVTGNKRVAFESSVKIDSDKIRAAGEVACTDLISLFEKERFILQNNVIVKPNSAQHTHSLFFKTNQKVRDLSLNAVIGLRTTAILGNQLKLSSQQAGFGLANFNLRNTIFSYTCQVDPVCDANTIRSPFRTRDGSCNNLANPSWGKSRTQFQRILNPVYSDGVRQPKRSISGNPLPSARLVSTSVVIDRDAPHETNTNWLTVYGQFIDHDLTSTPVRETNENGMKIQCCADDGKPLDPTKLHPECFPITIPDGDPFYSRFGQTCMAFVRSTPAPRFDCSLGHLEQMNQLTHYLDSSNVYGSDKEEAATLRTFQRGLLKVTPPRGHHDLDLLPPDETGENCANPANLPAHIKCFKAGDARSNVQPNLAITHTIFMREHNRLAAELSRLNPNWDDERLYHEARRILIAQMQHITYNEWLPVIIGRKKMQELALFPLDGDDCSTDYDPNLNPTIMNEFATAAFRFGHSLLQGKSPLINHGRNIEAQEQLRQLFFKSQMVYTPGNLDKFLIGMSTQPSQKFDYHFTEEVTNHLFEEAGKGFGLDLVALNIQRGRDHGLPGYNTYRSMCGLPRAKTFRDLLNTIPEKIVKHFEKLYETVDDIDLFIGAVSERVAEGAVISSTFQCIVADQFMRLKRGDRFFYDLSGQTGSFTKKQLKEIRKTSFARLICDNSKVLTTQPLVFKTTSSVNPIVDCKSPVIPRVDLLPWKGL